MSEAAFCGLSKMPTDAIAETLGFNSTWSFAHFFQKRVLISAAAYRKKHHLPIRSLRGDNTHQRLMQPFLQ